MTGTDADIPYSSYLSASITLWRVSAYWARPKPLWMAWLVSSVFPFPAYDLDFTFGTACEKPKFGNEGTTTSNAGPSSSFMSSGINLVASRKLPGPTLESYHLARVTKETFKKTFKKTSAIEGITYIRE